MGHQRFAAMKKTMGSDCTVATVEQLRFKVRSGAKARRISPLLQPFAMPDAPADFVDGLHAVMGAGDPTTKSGICIYILTANKSMTDRAFCNSDGDFLFVAQEGSFVLVTELGRLHITPGEIAVVPRGIRFAVQMDAPVRAYVLEIYDGHFVIPDLGPIGSNGLANPRDFQTPVAWYEDRDCKVTLLESLSSVLLTVSVAV